MALEGRTILSTRARGQGADLRERLEALGARVLEIPTIEIVPPKSWAPVDDAIGRLTDFDWIIFTSANAVEGFLSRSGPLEGSRIAAVGSQTARHLTERGAEPDLVPRDFRAEGLLEAFDDDLGGTRILIPRAEIAPEHLHRQLRERGADVEIVTVYRTQRPSGSEFELRRVLRDEEVDCITLTSGSTAGNLVEILGKSNIKRYLTGIALAVIGPVTRESATAVGLHVDIEAGQSTIPDLVEAIQQHYEPR
jgi:uroporphyrinogen III methyltransferase/synthase